MKQKRFKKLLMSRGLSRNEADALIQSLKLLNLLQRITHGELITLLPDKPSEPDRT